MRTREEMEAEIRGLQQLLAATDYKALKHADGALTDEEYEPTRASELNIVSRSMTCRQRLRRSRPPKGRW